eukprot:TRINITY_DN73032_c0_g1_i1.p2 TRINITY_DN73032_c0_g1~~TRINITY_DN73032_c0_g1_i1.p2  ORF type:complete len:178 (+),score=27.65 TRINITY_DN73032_c0_g1_i1:50-583(+)
MGSVRLVGAMRLWMLTVAVLVSRMQAERNPAAMHAKAPLFVGNATANRSHPASVAASGSPSFASALVSLGSALESTRESQALNNIMVVLAVILAFILGGLCMYKFQQHQQEQEPKQDQKHPLRHQHDEHGHEQESEDHGSHADGHDHDGRMIRHHQTAKKPVSFKKTGTAKRVNTAG